jgi:hypothetical protein
MIRVEFFCTRCNGSAQRRDPGDEVNTGYHAETYRTATEARRESGVHPAKWALDPHGLLVCPACIVSIEHDKPATAGLAPGVSEGHARVASPRPDGWPAIASPFTDG